MSGTLNLKPVDARLVIPITKVDEEKRLVKGVATGELLDAHGQVVDYDSAKKCMEAWKGNIREMHQPIAAGRAVAIEFDDVAKEITVTAYISKGAADTWAKILDGTLRDYSIGGKAIKKTEKVAGKDVERLIMQSIGELSVVDAGAYPNSGLAIVKMDGDTPELAQTLEADELAATEIMDPVDPTPAEMPAPPVAKLALVDVRGMVALAAAERVAKAVLITGPEAETVADADVLKRVEHFDIKNALNAINFLQELVTSEVWEADWRKQSGQEVKHEDLAQIELLRGACELVLAFLISEFMGQFDDVLPADASDEMKAAAAAAAADRTNVVKRVGSLLELAKAGRRHSRTDEQLLKDIHDNAVKLGAACATEKAASVVEPEASTEKVDTPADPPAATDITKLEGELSTTKTALEQAQATLRSTEGTIADLQTRLEAIEKQPLPGGPVSRPVEKSFGNGDTNTGDSAAVNGHEVIKALQALAETAKTTDERQRIAVAIVAKQRELGLDAVQIRTTSGS